MVARARARSNDGHRYSVESRQLVSTDLAIAVLGAPAAPERKKPRPFNGPKPRGGSVPTRLSEREIAGMRWLSSRMSLADLAERFNVPTSYVRSVLEYRVRAHIDPAPLDAEGVA